MKYKQNLSDLKKKSNLQSKYLLPLYIFYRNALFSLSLCNASPGYVEGTQKQKLVLGAETKLCLGHGGGLYLPASCMQAAIFVRQLMGRGQVVVVCSCSL